jgi:ankyrin repeat protein
LVAKLHLDFLADKTSLGEVRNALKSLLKGSDGYDQIYYDSMRRIQLQTESFSRLAMRTLKLIINVKRPLTVPELQHAIAVQSTTKVIDSETIPEIGLILEVCFGLVAVDQTSNIIRLVHSTAEEYFERKWKLWFPDAHNNIATACLLYLSLNIVEHPDRTTMWPFYGYASQYWVHHMRLQNTDCPIPMTVLTDKSLVTLIDKTINLRCFRGESHCFPAPNKGSSLHLAAHFGLQKTVEMLLSSGINCDSKDAYQRTPLAWVSDCADIGVAKILIEHGTNINHIDGYSCTPIYWAAGFGNVPLVKLLLKNGARTDIRDRSGLLALDWAVTRGHFAVARAFIENGVYTLDSKLMSTWEIMLDLARDCGLIQVLTEKNSNNHQCQRTLMDRAVRQGYQSEVERLLDAGVCIDAEDNQGGTPLLRAIDSGRLDMVKCLVNRGANIRHKDKLNRDMLHGGAVNGQANIIQFLLEIDDSLDVNRKDENSYTALHDAVRKGHVEVVKVLLAHGADSHIKAKNGKTPFTIARTNGRNDLLGMLQAA